MIEWPGTSALVATATSAGLFALGLGISGAELARVRECKGALARGLLVNFGVYPLLCWLLVGLADLPPAIALGLFLCAAAPGGNAGPILAQHAGADAALAVAHLVALAVTAVVAVPLLVTVWSAGSSTAEPLALGLQMSASVVLHVVLPLLAGALLARQRPSLAMRLQGPATAAARWLLLAVLVLFAVTHAAALLAGGWRSLGVSALQCAGGAACALVAAPAAPRQRAALLLTTHIRNLALCLFIASRWFAGPEVTCAILSYGLLMFGSGLVLAHRFRPLAAAARGTPGSGPR
jgi:BASS family bile acid:Na+ symporter